MADKTQNRLKSHHLSNHAATFLNSSINVYLVLFCLWLLRVIIIIMCGQFSLVLGRPLEDELLALKEEGNMRATRFISPVKKQTSPETRSTMRETTIIS